MIRLIPILFIYLFTFLPHQSADAATPQITEAHWRYSQNGKFALWYDPFSVTQRVCSGPTKALLWTFNSGEMSPFGTDDSDGCIYVANDGRSVAALTYPSNAPDGLTFFFADGSTIIHDFFDVDAGLAPWFHALPSTLLRSLDIPDYHNENLWLNDSELYVHGPGLLSHMYNMTDGQWQSASLNWPYFGACLFTYGVPLILMVLNLIRRGQTRHPELLRPGNVLHQYVRYGIVAVFVYLNFAGLVLYDYDGSIKFVGRVFRQVGFMGQIVALPVILLYTMFNFSRRRKIEIAPMWFATITAGVITTIGARYHFDLGSYVQERTARTLLAVIPIPFVVHAVSIHFRYKRQQRRLRSGCCFVCGYDLRESEGTCPECGTSI